MPATTTTTMLPTTTHGSVTGNYLGGSADFVSDEFKGDGYYGFADGVHTTQTRTTSFVGIITLQGSLATDPASTDWVDISTVVGDGSTAITNSFLTNFTGNYVWIRASVTSFSAGTINSVLLAH
jgi:hypothetical protein